jgi:hypothetical protein
MIGRCAACDERFVSFCNRPDRRYCSKKCQCWAKMQRTRERETLGLRLVSWLLRTHPDWLASFIVEMAKDKKTRSRGPAALPSIPQPKLVAHEMEMKPS